MSVPGFMLIRPPRGESNLIHRSVSNTAAGGTPFANVMSQQGNECTRPASLPLPPLKETPMTPEMMRANTQANAEKDLRRTEALNAMTANFTHPGNPFALASNLTTMRNLRTVFGGFGLRAPNIPMGGSIKGQALLQAQRQQELQGAKGAKGSQQALHAQNNGANLQPMPPLAPRNGEEIGKLSARFESGKAGIAAIGYDRHGGTSYGKYQIASRVGSMDNFLKFLDKNAPDIATSLRGGGPANTGSRSGAMPDMWRQIAAEQPDRFDALQEKFIYDSHYAPALRGILEKTSLKESQISGAMQEVLWSTAVQHGPSGAVRIFAQAAEGLGDKAQGKNFDTQFISNVYDIRAEQFGSSTEQVQNSVRNRMQQEKMLALNLLTQNNSMA